MVIILISAFHNLSWPKSGFVQPKCLNALFLSFWPWVHQILNQKFVKLFVSLKADFAVKTICKHSQSPVLYLSLLLSVYSSCSHVNQNHLLWIDLMPAEINKLKAHDAILRHKWKDTTYGSQVLVNHNSSAYCVQMFAGPQIPPSVYHTFKQKNQNTMRKAIPICCNHAEAR